MIKAWTKVLADSRNRYFRIRRILYKWENPDLQVLRICSWRFKSEWNHVPKFLTTVKGANLMLPTERPSIFTLESCCFAPINMNSVLSSSRLSLSVSIHIRMSDIQCSMGTTGFVLEGSVRGRLIEFATSSSKIIGTVFDTRHITYIIRIA